MFIDVTRFGADRSLRLAVAAVAYLDTAPDGCAVRLVGGESLRVNETAEQVERRIDAALGFRIADELVDAAPTRRSRKQHA